MFHPLVDTWFARRFRAPTPIQERAWPAIAAGGDALITAPTGSGKTLAAFLFCLDRLVREAADNKLEDRTLVVYVSPLKALSNDVQKNLDQPIAELAALAPELGLAAPKLRTSVRTGDTPARDRLRDNKRPPHVLVTTPESLFILLTSASGRQRLSQVQTLILDEIHAVAADKRGAHLALSVERLSDLVVRAGHSRPQRIGLSATVEPMEVAARLLVGSNRPLPAVIDAGRSRELDLAVEVPRDELGAVCTNEQWQELYDRLVALTKEHRSTLVFVNTRRLVERVAHHLGERIGQDAVAAHHGSLSRTRRLVAEQRLKAGELKVVVATASLELGIDVGAIDLCCILGSPRSISTALQRIGRSGHAITATPKGRFFPLTRDQLLECAAIVRAARRGVLDAIALRKAPLDILAQQIVAVAAAEDRGEDEVFELCRSAAGYADLERRDFDRVVDMLAEGVSTRRGRAGALLHRDGVNRRLRGRRGARLVALTSGGAIPDNADYDVLIASDASKVGLLSEDFAVDSSAGDVFLLGNTSWRIRRVETGKVWVEDAQGAAPTVPFWLGEAKARPRELSLELGELREQVATKIQAEGTEATAGWLMEECALDRAGARLVCAYVEAGWAALGAVPSLTTVIAERFFDEAGGMQLILHAPFGARINRALGLALRKRFCRTFDFELQAAATDDGVLLSLGPQHSFPLESILELVRFGRGEGHDAEAEGKPAEAEGAGKKALREVLEQAALQAPMFGTRFRWNASRSLALLRSRGGRRVPPALQRMRADDLLAAVFPAQQGCQDNHGGLGAHIEPPDHPLVNETLRDCLEEVMDHEGLSAVLAGLHGGAIRFIGRDTPEPSVFSHEILNANPYAFLDDAPLEERRARAVSVRRGLPAEVVERVGGLDPEAIRTVVREAAPDIRTADELHDLLLDLGGLVETGPIRDAFGELFAVLCRDLRAARLLGAPGEAPVWVAAERRSLGEAVWPGRRFVPAIVAPPGSRGAERVDRDLALAELVRGRLALAGPTTAAALGRELCVEKADVGIALARLESEGTVLRGQFSLKAAGEVEWCDRRLLARIHRLTVDGLRRAIEPVSPADLLRFLFVWQGIRSLPQGRGSAPAEAAMHRGRSGLLRVIDQLEGVELAAGAWESEVLPARVARYEPRWLDELCLSGEVVWGRLTPREAGSAPTRAALITLCRRRDLGFLLAPRGGGAAEESEDRLSPEARDVLAVLRQSGALFLEELAGATRRGRGHVEDALWELVAAGRITGDGFSGLRALLNRSAPEALSGGWRVGRLRGGAAPVAAGRWALLRAHGGDSEPEGMEQLAALYLRRYGVVFKALLARESRAPSWSDLVRIYRRLEMRGEIRGGRLVASFVGEQFALPAALDSLRAVRRQPPSGEVVRLSACDPLNLTGIVTPGARVGAHLGSSVTYRDGVPVSDDGPAIEVGVAAMAS